jgi:hypothetical protein
MLQTFQWLCVGNGKVVIEEFDIDFRSLSGGTIRLGTSGGTNLGWRNFKEERYPL